MGELQKYRNEFFSSKGVFELFSMVFAMFVQRDRHNRRLGGQLEPNQEIISFRFGRSCARARGLVA